MYKKVLLCSLVAASALGANAGVLYQTGDLGPGYITLSSGNVAGGGLFSGAANPGLQAIPYGGTVATTTVGTWLAAGPDGTNNANPPGTPVGQATLSLGGGVTAVSFLWGSPDDYNSFTIKMGSGDIFSETATSLNTALSNVLSINQVQSNAYYIKFVATGGDTISKLTFESPGQNAIEISNVAVVPEPEAYGLALAGMGVVGFAMSRRRKS